MSCNGCHSHVKETLSKVAGVKNVGVNLEKGEATIEMESHIPMETFQDAMQKDGSKYSIYTPGGHHSNRNSNSSDMIRRHKYAIHGLTCNGCRSHVEEILSKVAGVKKASVDLQKEEAIIEMELHIPIETFQEALKKDGGTYSIHPREHHHRNHATPPKKQEKPKGEGSGVYYCPMHCEGDKTYEQPGDCHVCEMDLVEEQNLSTASSSQEWTCPMHPEVVKDAPGSCPICGMDLVPVQPDLSAQEKSYNKLRRKFWIAVGFTFPIILIAMSEMISGNPLYDIMGQTGWNWVQLVLSIPVVFYATWMFFERAYRSIKTWNLNMFTLIGIGAGVAWLFSIFGMLFPNFFPAQFKTEFGAVHVYFEVATVIIKNRIYKLWLPENGSLTGFKKESQLSLA